MYDITVIGGGVVGGLILRELSSYDAKICLLEKEEDVATGSSKANSGIVHAGFDAKEGTNKAKFNVLGSEMMLEVTSDLGVKFKNNGSLVVAFSDEDMETVNELYKRGRLNGVKGLEVVGRERLVELEPNISDEAVGALYAKTGGIVCPYELTVAAVGNAMDNGADLRTNFEVSAIEYKNGYFTVTSATGDTVETKYIVNAAGIYSDKVASMIGDNSFKVGARKGEYILLDKVSGSFATRTLFMCPTKKGKGILVSPTVDGNLLLGPTADEQEDKEDVSTTMQGLQTVMASANKLCKKVPLFNSITSFAGLRSFCDRHDFIIERSSVNDKFFNVAGIESPGLTSSPAIAKYVAEEAAKDLSLNKKENWNGKRTPDWFFKAMTDEEKNELIKKEPEYGKMVCRCEQVTLGEILHAIRTNPKACSIDAVKRRTRAGMGRCQGGFCQPVIAKVLSEELNIPFEEVTKKGKNSYLNLKKTK
ncbi:MAG TPA: FAD/NAD(P)-binding oxidoreductase [Clostridiales bacterium]|nr:FAD/NAD(P)-binding oxidoreductase [Clostridiales bacterium]